MNTSSFIIIQPVYHTLFHITINMTKTRLKINSWNEDRQAYKFRKQTNNMPCITTFL